MRAVVQRCGYASVNVNGKIVGEIGKGVMVLVGFAPDDTEKDIDYIIEKLPAVIERLRMMSPLYDAVTKQK